MRNSSKLITIAFAGTMLAMPVIPSFAAEGAATGNGTSTPAGPASDNAGPTKAGGASGMSSMKSGGMKSMKKHHHHHHHHKSM